MKHISIALLTLHAPVMVGCAQTSAGSQVSVAAETLDIASKTYVYRAPETGNLNVSLRPDRRIPDGYAFTGQEPVVTVDHDAATITVSGFYTFEKTDMAEEQADWEEVKRIFEFGPPKPVVYTISYVPDDARGAMAQRKADLKPKKTDANKVKLMPAIATLDQAPDTGTMTITVVPARCFGGMGRPLEDDMTVGVNVAERKIFVVGTFRFTAPQGGVPKFCRVNPDIQKRVFELEALPPGPYEIVYTVPVQNKGLHFPGKGLPPSGLDPSTAASEQ